MSSPFPSTPPLRRHPHLPPFPLHLFPLFQHPLSLAPLSSPPPSRHRLPIRPNRAEAYVRSCLAEQRLFFWHDRSNRMEGLRSIKQGRTEGPSFGQIRPNGCSSFGPVWPNDAEGREAPGAREGRCRGVERGRGPRGRRKRAGDREWGGAEKGGGDGRRGCGEKGEETGRGGEERGGRRRSAREGEGGSAREEMWGGEARCRKGEGGVLSKRGG